ncbi:hypothetical protein EDC04DRAFT_870866 [Pisolithus marmoratus]|nr:hypothetical protein EDC04DRAFT_870866 [Pisolithus marmoratus]
MESIFEKLRCCLSYWPRFLGEPRELPEYLEDVYKCHRAQRVLGDPLFIATALLGAPSEVMPYWACLVEPAEGNWTKFKLMVIKQSLETARPSLRATKDPSPTREPASSGSCPYRVTGVCSQPVVMVSQTPLCRRWALAGSIPERRLSDSFGKVPQCSREGRCSHSCSHGRPRYGSGERSRSRARRHSQEYACCCMSHHPRSPPHPRTVSSESPPDREAAFSSGCSRREAFISSSASPPRSLCSKAPPHFPPSSEPLPRRRFSFCFFCGRDGHIRAQCKICASYLAAGKCRIVGGRVVLPTGAEIPREALGRTLRAHLDSWALTHTPRSFRDQGTASSF